MGIALVIGIVFLIAGLAMIVGAGGVFFRQRKERSNAIRATGAVVDLAKSAGQRGYLYYPVVEFEAAFGLKTRFQAQVGSNPAGYKVGQQVTVLYDPQNPEKAEIDSASSLYFFPGCLLGMGAGLSLLGLCLSGMMLLVMMNPQ